MPVELAVRLARTVAMRADRSTLPGSTSACRRAAPRLDAARRAGGTSPAPRAPCPQTGGAGEQSLLAWDSGRGGGQSVEWSFDSLDRSKLKEMLRQRVADESLIRLVGKCLQGGVLDGEEYSEPESGVVQGSILSPLLGNVYLHCVLDVWFEHEVLPRLRGKAHLIRYCDDFIIGFEREDDARRVTAVLKQRLERFGLALHPDKTRLLSFQRPPKGARERKGLATFDFLGFTLHWRRNRKGGWVLGFKTRKAKLRRVIVTLAEWCRCHRHWSVKEQHAALTRRLQGHFNYFGVNGNLESLMKVQWAVKRVWYKWLRRRSNRKRLNWQRFSDIYRVFPLPEPRICVRIWA